MVVYLSPTVSSILVLGLIHDGCYSFKVQVQVTVLGVGIAIEYVFIE